MKAAYSNPRIKQTSEKQHIHVFQAFFLLKLCLPIKKIIP